MLKRGLDYIRQKLSIEPRIDWEKLEKSTPEEQKAFLDEWADKFKIKPFSATVPKIKIADHLMVKRYTHHLMVNRYIYTHHLICTEVRKNSIMAMEFGLRNGFKIGIWELLDNLQTLAELHEKELTFKELENMKVQKILWPKKLRRFERKAAVERARGKQQKGEAKGRKEKYDLSTNNCEHFVVWCICGLEVSLQLKSWHTWAKMVFNFVCATSRDFVIQTVSHLLVYLVFLFPKVLDNTSDENSSNSKLVNYHETIEFLVGVAIAVVIQLRLCYHKWEIASDDRESEDIPTDNDLCAKRVEIIAKAVLHLGLGSLGFFAGLQGLTREHFLWGIICTIARVVAGIAAGNLLGAIAKWYVENENSLNTSRFLVVINVIAAILLVVFV